MRSKVQHNGTAANNKHTCSANELMGFHQTLTMNEVKVNRATLRHTAVCLVSDIKDFLNKKELGFMRNFG